MRSEIADERRDAVEALVRALHHAAAHFVEPANAGECAGLLARPEYLDAPQDAILRAINDRLRLTPGSEPIPYPDFMFQHREAANFPCRSQGAWLYSTTPRWAHSRTSESAE